MYRLKKIGVYVLYSLAEALIIAAAMILSVFVPKSFSQLFGVQHSEFLKVFMYIVVITVLAFIYLYLFLRKKGGLFTPFAAVIIISLAMLAYFSMASELRMEMGVEIFARVFVLPVGTVSAVLSSVLEFIKNKMKIKK